MTDERVWLEDIEGTEAMAWVGERNAEAEADLFADPTFVPLRQRILEVLEADDRIAYPSVHGDPADDPIVHNLRWCSRGTRRTSRSGSASARCPVDSTACSGERSTSTRA